MADLGAEVIKIEEPDLGDNSRRYGPFLNDTPHPERSGLFLFLNANKLGITLNLKTITGRKIFNQLLAQADALVENYPPRVVEDLELDYSHLREINRGIILTSITPFGHTGPYKDYKAYEINCSAAGGVSRGIGYPDREPLTMPMSQGAYQAGISAAVGTLCALLARKVIGEGQHVDVSEVEVWTNLNTGAHLLTYIYRGVTGTRRGRHGSFFYYPHSILPCKNGQIFLIAPQIEQWTRFIDLMGTPEWSMNPRYRNRRAMGGEYPDEVDNLIIPWLKEHTKEELFSLCRKNRIPLAPLRTVDGLVEDPHLKAREFFVEVDHQETGMLKYPGAPFKLSKTPWAIEHSAPLLGEHNEEIFVKRLGYSKDDLVRLRGQGII